MDDATVKQGVIGGSKPGIWSRLCRQPACTAGDRCRYSTQLQCAGTPSPFCLLLLLLLLSRVPLRTEYNSVIWSPSLKRDIALLEQVQKRFTKRLPGLKDHSYDERLKLLNLQRLELRRIWSDLLWCYKIVFGLARVNKEEFFTLRLSRTRGHPYKLLSILTVVQ